MIQKREKEKPYPSRLRGRGADVPKALFYGEFYLIPVK